MAIPFLFIAIVEFILIMVIAGLSTYFLTDQTRETLAEQEEPLEDFFIFYPNYPDHYFFM